MHLRRRLRIDKVLLGSRPLGLCNTAKCDISTTDWKHKHGTACLLARLRYRERDRIEAARKCNIPLHDQSPAWRTTESPAHQMKRRFVLGYRQCLEWHSRHAFVSVSPSDRGLVCRMSGWSSCNGTRQLFCASGTDRKAIHDCTALRISQCQVIRMSTAKKPWTGRWFFCPTACMVMHCEPNTQFLPQKATHNLFWKPNRDAPAS